MEYTCRFSHTNKHFFLCAGSETTTAREDVQRSSGVGQKRLGSQMEEEVVKTSENH